MTILWYFYNTLLHHFLVYFVRTYFHTILNFYNYFKNIFFLFHIIYDVCDIRLRVRKSLRGVWVSLSFQESQLIKRDRRRESFLSPYRLCYDNNTYVIIRRHFLYVTFFVATTFCLINYYSPLSTEWTGYNVYNNNSYTGVEENFHWWEARGTRHIETLSSFEFIVEYRFGC